MNELKPCPFCLVTPTIYELKCGWYVDCNNDECNHHPRQQNSTHTKQDSINKWNTRAPQSEWISVADRLPDSDGRYLIVSHGGNIVTRMFYTHHDKSFFNRVIATHWMPLPLPPKEGLPC